MNIAIHLIQLDGGGVDTCIKSMINFWPSKNDKFYLLTNGNNRGLNFLDDLVKDRNVEIIKLDDIKLNHSLVMKILGFILFPLLFFYQKEKSKKILRLIDGIDVLMIQNGTYPGSYLSLAALWAGYELKLKKRMLVVHHGAVHGNIIRKPLSRLIDQKVHSWASDIVTVSRATRETMIRNYGFDPSINPIRVIHNGIALSSEQTYGADNLREIYSSLNGKLIIGIVGRIERYKGHEDLLLALSEIDHKELDKIKVLFIGSGHQNEIVRLKRMISNLGLEDYIIFPGFVKGDAISIIRQLDLLLMITKDFEGFGLTIAEAMAAGTPVVATSVGAVAEFVDDSVGYLIPPEAPDEIASSIKLFLNNRDEFWERSKNASIHIKKYSASRMAFRYHRLLKL